MTHDTHEACLNTHDAHKKAELVSNLKKSEKQSFNNQVLHLSEKIRRCLKLKNQSTLAVQICAAKLGFASLERLQIFLKQDIASSKITTISSSADFTFDYKSQKADAICGTFVDNVVGIEIEFSLDFAMKILSINNINFLIDSALLKSQHKKEYLIYKQRDYILSSLLTHKELFKILLHLTQDLIDLVKLRFKIVELRMKIKKAFKVHNKAHKMCSTRVDKTNNKQFQRYILNFANQVKNHYTNFLDNVIDKDVYIIIFISQNKFFAKIGETCDYSTRVKQLKNDLKQAFNATFINSISIRRNVYDEKLLHFCLQKHTAKNSIKTFNPRRAKTIINETYELNIEALKILCDSIICYELLYYYLLSQKVE